MKTVLSKFCLAFLLAIGTGSAFAERNLIALDTEFFEFGATVGVVNIEDLTSELTIGLSGTLRATEDFFLQLNYERADISLSSVETSSQGPYSGDRTYKHLNLLLGYNIFQGEVFRAGRSGFSSLYIVGGVGDVEYLNESSFALVYGLGYQMALSRRWNIRLDYRQIHYDFELIDQEEKSTTDSELLLGLTWTF